MAYILCRDSGLAGGTWFAQTLGGVFNTTKYAKLGDKGSEVLPYRPTGVVWKRGGVAKPTWYLRAKCVTPTATPTPTPASRPLMECC